MDSDELRSVTEALQVAVTSSLRAERCHADDEELLDYLVRCEEQRRRLEYAQLVTISEARSRGLAGSMGYRDLRTLLIDQLLLSPRAASTVLDRVDHLLPGAAVTGAALPARLPATAAAHAEGALSADQAQIIVQAAAAVPARLADRVDVLDSTLAAQAATLDAPRLRKAAAHVLAWLDPDGPVPPEDEPARRASRFFRVRRIEHGPDAGMADVVGRLTAECTAFVEAMLAAHDTGPITEIDADTVKDGGDPAAAPADPSGPDVRSRDQRAHDALEHGMRLLFESGRLPRQHGAPATVIVTVALDDLERRAGGAVTATGGTLSIGDALRLASDSQLLPAVLSGDGELLHLGRAKRIATRAQRRALIARDRGCTFPGCTRPPSETQVHHLREWVHGGATDLDNLALACGYHNNEAPRMGWRCTLRNGTAYWHRSTGSDRQRQPQRNVLHHPTRLVPPG